MAGCFSSGIRGSKILRELASLWIGGALGQMEIASLKSLMHLGHPVTLFSYSPVPNVPVGVRTRDAAEIFCGNRILIYRDKRKPSPALHANLFRYAMLQKTELTWVDLDIIGLRPFPDTDYVMGFETGSSVNNAVLRLPRNSPALQDLLCFSPSTRGIAPHIIGARRLKYWVRSFGQGYPIEKWAWGSTGPKALTIYLSRHNELQHALRPTAFYPIGVHAHNQFLEPGRWCLSDFGQDTFCLHLWGSRIRNTLHHNFGDNVPAGSLYSEILVKFL